LTVLEDRLLLIWLTQFIAACELGRYGSNERAY
jgi:hypothetical protein